MLTKSSHGLAKEGICRIRLAWPNCSQPKVISLSGCVSRFLPNCTNIACQFKWLSVCQNIEEYIPVLVIGTDGPPKPKKNKGVPLSISICVPNFFLMKLNATKRKEPRVCFVKRPSATPFTNWSTSTQNSLFAQGSRQGSGGGEGVSKEIGAVDLAAICVAPLRSVLEYNVTWLDITPFLPICLVQ